MDLLRLAVTLREEALAEIAALDKYIDQTKQLIKSGALTASTSPQQLGRDTQRQSSEEKKPQPKRRITIRPKPAQGARPAPARAPAPNPMPPATNAEPAHSEAAKPETANTTAAQNAAEQVQQPAPKMAVSGSDTILFDHGTASQSATQR